MQVIGFNLTKISALREEQLKRASINTHIEFTKVEKEKIEMLKDSEAIKLNFRFTITYGDPNKNSDKKEDKEQNSGELVFEGLIVLSLSKDQSKEFQKAWKNKQVPQDSVVPLYNMILKKCSVKALQLEDDLNLPLHIPFPQVKKQEKS
ncbi:hypothetical protein J4408_00030 [Candidatus Pacearchaeota archaeon]|nr:hypothetical protein [Candidatus Pacearchaeota archaeon]